jgi:hypothetical protein
VITQAPRLPEGGAWFPLSLVSQLQAKLNRARLVALRTDASEAQTIWTPESIRIAKICSIKNVAKVRIEPHVELLMQFEDLE